MSLTEADADLFWKGGHCFVCKERGHRSEACKKVFGPIRYVCSSLEDPYGKSFGSVGRSLELMDVSRL